MRAEHSTRRPRSGDTRDSLRSPPGYTRSRASPIITAMSDSAATPAVASVSSSALFIAFLKVGLSGFGGVLPFARRMIVERRHWLSEAEFLDVAGQRAEALGQQRSIRWLVHQPQGTRR